jgi:hypothetical protein
MWGNSLRGIGQTAHDRVVSVETASPVSYAMIRRQERVLFARRWLYQLVRVEHGVVEEIVAGYGPRIRNAVGLYLQDVRGLGGPDADAAAAAIRAGWMTEVSP